MEAFDAKTVDEFWSDADNTALRYKNIMVQVRTGDITEEILDRLVMIARLVRTRQSGPVALLSVIEQSASVPTAEVRKRQSEVIREIFGDNRSFAAVLVTATGPKAMLLRAFMRLIVAGDRRLAVFDGERSTAVWLHKHLKTPSEAEIVALIAHARARAAGSAGPGRPDQDAQPRRSVKVSAR